MQDNYLEKIEALKKIIMQNDNIVFFGGAGVSTESNIPDFRSPNGLYKDHNQNKYRPEEIISHSFFINHPKVFYDYYFSNMVYPKALPNGAHFVLSALEEKKKIKAIITQNIDGLHQLAGSKNVIELHGSVHRNYCMKCHKFYDLNELLDRSFHPYCDCGGIIKPDVVLYEEQLDEEAMNKAIEYILNANVLIIAGTSLQVNPAASFVSFFRGRALIIINLEETPYDRYATLVIHEKVGKVLLDIMKKDL